MISLPSLRVLRSLCLCAVALAGCDTTGEYEARIAEAATAAPQKAGGNSALLHDAPTPIKAADGVDVCMIKLPKFFLPNESQWIVTGAKDKNGKDVTADRAQPAGTPIPGWSATYEVPVDNGAGQKLPVTVYFGGIAGSAANVNQTHVGIVPLAAANPALPDWMTRDISAEATLDGTNAGGADVKSPTVCKFFVAETATHLVTIAWRCPTACQANCKFDESVNAAMQSVVLASKKAGAVAPPPMGPGAPSGL